jgi:hypothetical protein
MKQSKDLSMPVMIDIETLGTSARAPIIAIGAVEFEFGTWSPNIPSKFNSFYQRVNWTSAMKGREPDAETIRWWMGQSEEARAEVTAPNIAITMERALQELHAWYPTNKSANPWSNGSSFDIAILDDAYQARDMRTLVDVAQALTSWHKSDVPFEGAKHTALDDAIHQTKVVLYLWEGLEKTATSIPGWEK